MRIARHFWRSNCGATSIEYAMIAFFISILVVAGATSIGTKLNAKITPVQSGLN